MSIWLRGSVYLGILGAMRYDVHDSLWCCEIKVHRKLFSRVCSGRPSPDLCENTPGRKLGILVDWIVVAACHFVVGRSVKFAALEVTG